MQHFGDIKIEKRKVHDRKNLILLEDVYIKNTFIQYGFFRRKKIINILSITKRMMIKLNHYALCFQNPKTGAYVKSYDEETKWIFIEDNQFLRTYNGQQRHKRTLLRTHLQ